MKRKTNLRYILIILSLIIILVGGVLILIKKEKVSRMESPQKVPQVKKPKEILENFIEADNSKWKTYRNMDYGFEVKYPPALRIRERGNGILIENLPIITGKGNLKEKSLEIYLTPNCFGLSSEAEEAIITTFNNREIFVERWRVIPAGGAVNPDYYWTVVKANTPIRENQCITFELIFSYSNYPKKLPSLLNEGETSILYQIISTVTVFQPQERFVKVLFPNGGEQLIIGKSYTITWEAKNVKKIDILLVERKNRNRRGRKKNKI